MKNAFACLSEMAQIVGNLCNNVHVRVHAPTAKNTTLHRSSIHSDNDADPKHNKTRQFCAHLDQYRNCLFRLLRVCGCDRLILVGPQGNRSWQLLVVVGLVNVLRQSNEETRRPVMSVVLNRALGREPRVHRGRRWADFRENRVHGRLPVVCACVRW